jgi:hypothetical protein
MVFLKVATKQQDVCCDAIHFLRMAAMILFAEKREILFRGREKENG